MEADIRPMEKNKILLVGLVCVDVICEVDYYPAEDEKVSALSQRKQTGGNAANTCSLLGCLGSHPSLLCTISSHQKKFIEDTLREFGVDISYTVIVDGECPYSNAWISLATGSRTITHYKTPNFREPMIDDFHKINLSKFSWVHFEGRNIETAVQMIKLIHAWNSGKEKKIKISVEIESPKPNIEGLIPVADVVFIAKEFAEFKGWKDGRETLDAVSNLVMENATVICPWGEKGAGCKTGRDGEIFWCKAFTPVKVCDTLAAGDTFIGATIYALNAGESVQTSVTFGCRVAGFKIGFKGWPEFRAQVLSVDFVRDVVEKYNKKCSEGSV